jgi:hypothetical protein
MSRSGAIANIYARLAEGVGHWDFALGVSELAG